MDREEEEREVEALEEVDANRSDSTTLTSVGAATHSLKDISAFVL